MHSLTLKSLRKLCYNQKIRQQLREFFFKGPPEEGQYEDRFMDILQDLFDHKNLKIDIMALLRAMIEVSEDKEFFTREMRNELYMNVFNGRPKLVSAVAHLMEAFDDVFWSQVIELLDFNQEIDIPEFIKKVLSVEEVNCDPQIMSEILLKNVKNHPEISRKAAALLVELMRNAEMNSKQEMLKTIDDILCASLDDENTFMIVINCISVDFELTSKTFKENPIKFFPTVIRIVQAFDGFKSLTSLYNLVTMLKDLTKISPGFVLKKVQENFNLHYNKFLEIFGENNQNLDPIEAKEAITKVTCLLENRSWNILKECQIEFVYKLSQFLLSPEDPMMIIAMRLHCNVIKHTWARCVLEKPVPFNNQELAEGIKKYFTGLGDFLENVPEIPDIQFVLSSFMDIALCFQPSMRTRHNHEIFKLVNFEMHKGLIRDLVGLIELHVFLKDQNKTLFQRSMILQSWISFCCNYINPPSVTASSKIITYYNLKSPFKTDFETLFNHLLQDENAFEKTVAISILDLSNHENLSMFRSFYQALDEFLRQKFSSDAVKKSAVSSAICSFILPKIGKAVENREKNENENRLGILEYVSILAKNFNSTIKERLEQCIPGSLAKADLTEGEKKDLANFVGFLRQR